MQVLHWMGEHPVLTFFLAFIAYSAIVDSAKAFAKSRNISIEVKPKKGNWE